MAKDKDKVDALAADAAEGEAPVAPVDPEGPVAPVDPEGVDNPTNVSEADLERIVRAVERFAEGSIADTVEKVAAIATEATMVLGAVLVSERDAEDPGLVGSVTIASATCVMRRSSEDGVNAVFEDGDGRQFELRHFAPALVKEGMAYDVTISLRAPQ